MNARKRISNLTQEELITFFAELGYRDREGHPLTNCVDFQTLVEIYFEARGYVESLAAFRRSVCDKLHLDCDDSTEDILFELEQRD